MKKTLTLTLLFLRSLIPTMAQTPSDTLMMDFENVGVPLQLDSIYPPGCWQVGQPDKPIFTSAYSEPNALVTDTMLPHAASITCYAQFSPLISDQEYIGKWLSFRHRMDMDSLQSFGWVESKGAFQSDWSRVGYWTDWSMQLTDFIGDGAITDTGVVFTGSNAEWTDVEMTMDCISVINGGGERGGGQAVRQYRFVFQGNPNTNARDGWMIDDVRLSSRSCMGGIDERAEAPVRTFPNPADTRLNVLIADNKANVVRWEVLQLDGREVLAGEQGLSGSFDIHTERLAPGTYVLRCANASRSWATRFVVEH